MILATGDQKSLPSSVVFRANALEFNAPLTFEEWRDVGLRLRSAHRALNWWVGDWLAYGQASYTDSVYGNRLQQGVTKYASELLGIEEGTLRTWKWVSSAVKLSMRIDNLTFYSAREIVSGAPEHHYPMWIDRAVTNDLSYREIRRTMREFYAEEKPEPNDEGVDSFLEETRQYVRNFKRTSKDWDDEVADRYLYEELSFIMEWAQMRLSRSKEQ